MARYLIETTRGAHFVEASTISELVKVEVGHWALITLEGGGPLMLNLNHVVSISHQPKEAS